MTDCIHYEKYMSRDEIALRLNIETALRECCESECAELKKELIEAKQKLDSNLTLLKGANANASALSLENEKLKKELEDIKTAFEIKSDNLNRQSEEIVKLRQAYDCSREKFVTEFNNVTYNYECAIKENERLREKVENQRIQLVDVQQALLNRNMTIEALKKEVKETRVVFEPNSYLIDIQAKDEEIKTLRKKNLDLKNENEGLKLKLASNTQPLYIENLNVTYYANGPIWTNEEEEDNGLH